MQLKILCPQWGHEQLAIEAFFVKVKAAGYDGVDTWMPENSRERSTFIRLLGDYGLSIVSHQHQARGRNIDEFCRSFEYYLHMAMECSPILINSHSGRDFFSLEEQLLVIDTAETFAIKNDIRVVHETHRGRLGFSPGNAKELFRLRPEMKITADLSHWVCVTESYLENFQEVLLAAIARTEHVHARVGFTQGPQIPDPRNSFWQDQVQYFLGIWRQIVEYKRSIGAALLTMTPEFGPPPYMWINNADGAPVVSQWDVNVFMKDLLRKTLVE